MDIEDIYRFPTVTLPSLQYRFRNFNFFFFNISTKNNEPRPLVNFYNFRQRELINIPIDIFISTELGINVMKSYMHSEQKKLKSDAFDK